jgi:hypothetical protein
MVHGGSRQRKKFLLGVDPQRAAPLRTTGMVVIPGSTRRDTD